MTVTRILSWLGAITLLALSPLHAEHLTRQTPQAHTTCTSCAGQGVTLCQSCRGADLTRLACGSCRGVNLAAQRCSGCRGSGRYHGSSCTFCRGSGHRQACKPCLGTGHRLACGSCHGAPQRATCTRCAGSGKIVILRSTGHSHASSSHTPRTAVRVGSYATGSSYQTSSIRRPTCQTTRPSSSITYRSGNTSITYTTGSANRQYTTGTGQRQYTTGRSYRSPSYAWSCSGGCQSFATCHHHH